MTDTERADNTNNGDDDLDVESECPSTHLAVGPFPVVQVPATRRQQWGLLFIAILLVTIVSFRFRTCSSSSSSSRSRGLPTWNMPPKQQQQQQRSRTTLLLGVGDRAPTRNDDPHDAAAALNAATKGRNRRDSDNSNSSQTKPSNSSSSNNNNMTATAAFNRTNSNTTGTIDIFGGTDIDSVYANGTTTNATILDPTTINPTWSPTWRPTWSPTDPPTWSPTDPPTWSPTDPPTWSPPTETPSVAEDDGILRILTLGDSITTGGLGHYSYRYYLWRRLVQELPGGGDQVDMVGSLRNAAYDQNPVWPPVSVVDPDTGTTRNWDFDRDHEGHWGWTTDEVLGQLCGWLDSYPVAPTVALVHLGTGDCIAGEDPFRINQEQREVVISLRMRYPDMHVFVAKLIPSDWLPGLRDCIRAVNDAWYDDGSLQGMLPWNPISFVDMATGFDPETDTYDELHPTSLASEVMASKWFDAIMTKVPIT